MKASSQMAVWRRSLRGGSQRGDVERGAWSVERELERQRWRCQAVAMRRRRQRMKNPNENADGFAASQSNGHNVGLLRILKK